jgi:cobalamin biosynthesis protein CbiD
MSIRNRFQGRQTQFHIELLYGFLFIAGFGYLAFRVDPRVAAFEGGLVVGYLLRIWEKMSIYERILEEVVSEEAQRQVESEVQDQVADEVASEIDAQVGGDLENLDAQIDERIDEVDDLQQAEG